MNKIRVAGLIDIHVAVLLFGLAGLFGKFLTLPAWCIVLGRTAFAAVALGGVLLVNGHGRRPKGIGSFGRFVLLGLILAIHWITFFRAIQISTVAVGLLAYSTFPVFITCIEPWWFKERRRPVDAVTALLVATGLGIMAYPSPLGGSMIAGLIWGTLSGLAFAVLSLLNRQAVREYAPAVVAFYQNAVAAVLLLPMLVRADVHLGAGQIAMLALLGIVCTALSHALFIRGLAFVRAQLASVIACLEPVYGIVLAYFLLHERPSIHTLAGGAVILLTAAVAMFRRPAVV